MRGSCLHRTPAASALHLHASSSIQENCAWKTTFLSGYLKRSSPTDGGSKVTLLLMPPRMSCLKASQCAKRVVPNLPTVRAKNVPKKIVSVSVGRSIPLNFKDRNFLMAGGTFSAQIPLSDSYFDSLGISHPRSLPSQIARCGVSLNRETTPPAGSPRRDGIRTLR